MLHYYLTNIITRDFYILLFLHVTLYSTDHAFEPSEGIGALF